MVFLVKKFETKPPTGDFFSASSEPLPPESVELSLECFPRGKTFLSNSPGKLPWKRKNELVEVLTINSQMFEDFNWSLYDTFNIFSILFFYCAYIN